MRKATALPTVNRDRRPFSASLRNVFGRASSAATWRLRANPRTAHGCFGSGLASLGRDADIHDGLDQAGHAIPTPGFQSVVRERNGRAEKNASMR